MIAIECATGQDRDGKGRSRRDGMVAFGIGIWSWDRALGDGDECDGGKNGLTVVRNEASS